MTGKEVVVRTRESGVEMTFTKDIIYDCKQKFLIPRSGDFHDNSYALKLDVNVREYDRVDCDQSRIGTLETIGQGVVFQIPAQYDEKNHRVFEERVLTIYIID